VRQILAAGSVDLLAQLAWSKTLLAFDFDGTLAPIVAERDGAKMRARTRALFERLCGLYPCAVLSGRGREDVEGRIGVPSLRYVVGNHGLEPGAGLESFAGEVALVKPVVEAALRELPGVDVEDKRYSLAIHYRRSRRRGEARRAIHALVAALPVPMRLIPGKLVVNVVPLGAPNKGDALLALRSQEQADTALYVGDDVTDEDVFVLDQPGRLLSIRVGRTRHTAAAYFLRDQREIDRLIARLIELRTPAHGEKK